MVVYEVKTSSRHTKNNNLKWLATDINLNCYKLGVLSLMDGHIQIPRLNTEHGERGLRTLITIYDCREKEKNYSTEAIILKA